MRGYWHWFGEWRKRRERRRWQEAEIVDAIILSERDSLLFAEAIAHPPAPNARLRALMRGDASDDDRDESAETMSNDSRSPGGVSGSADDWAGVRVPVMKDPPETSGFMAINPAIEARLIRIEEKLDRLLADQQPPRRDPPPPTRDAQRPRPPDPPAWEEWR